jgi:hypothetical protein
VVNAIFIYNVIVDRGCFETIRDSFAGVSNYRRIQVVLSPSSSRRSWIRRLASGHRLPSTAPPDLDSPRKPGRSAP